AVQPRAWSWGWRIRRLASGHTSFLERRQYLIRSKRQRRDADADRVGDGVRDGGAGGNNGRLAQSDHTAFVVSRTGHHVHHELADIADAGQLVKFHVRVQHAPGLDRKSTRLNSSHQINSYA